MLQGRYKKAQPYPLDLKVNLFDGMADNLNTTSRIELETEDLQASLIGQDIKASSPKLKLKRD